MAIASMIQRGLLRIVEKRGFFVKIQQVDRARDHERGELRPIESMVWGWTGFPALPREDLRVGGLASHVGRKCSGFEADLADRDLLAPEEEMKSLAIRLWAFGVAAIILLGAYKLVVAT